MVGETKTVKVTPGSEVDRLLDEVDGTSLILERDGVRYRLTREPDEDIWEGYDPEAVRKALAETAGSWADLDTDKLIADIYRWREEGSRPADRP
ncbi:MAG: hypothetical protein ACRDJE_12785 [Dehalococcoidia bacterium]